MKIIDKIQDFYEYDIYMYGDPDNSIIWDRTTVTRYIDEFPQKDKIKKYINALIFKHNILNENAKSYKHNSIIFTQKLIGMYPYVYLCITMHELSCKVDELYKWQINLTENEFRDREYLNELINEYLVDRHADLPYYLTMKNIDKEFSNYSLYNNIQFKDYNDSFIKECPELFKLLDTPTFIIDNNYNNYITTDAIIMTSGLLKHYNREDIDKNIYTNIEQFIAQRNMEEIHEADNKIKIINAGFDLKTSFRNM